MRSHKGRQSRAAEVSPGLRIDGDGPLAQLQRTAGNAAVCQLMSSLHERTPPGSPEVLVVRAGTTAAQAPPGGMDAIQANEASSALGAAAGWTGIKMAGAFVSPNFTTTWIHPPKPGGDHFVTVDPPVASPDAVHDSFYPAAGDHKWGTRTAPGPGKKTYEAWHRVTDAMSATIREGEQEHLDDARRAYDLTYGLITTTIAGMAGQKFGPAKSPTEAEQLATDAFDAKLPAALSVKKPAYRAAWLQMLETLLKQSKLRDLRGWHDLQHAKPLTKGDRYIYPLEPTNTTNIRKPGDKSVEVVNYPDATP